MALLRAKAANNIAPGVTDQRTEARLSQHRNAAHCAFPLPELRQGAQAPKHIAEVRQCLGFRLAGTTSAPCMHTLGA